MEGSNHAHAGWVVVVVMGLASDCQEALEVYLQAVQSRQSVRPASAPARLSLGRLDQDPEWLLLFMSCSNCLAASDLYVRVGAAHACRNTTLDFSAGYTSKYKANLTVATRYRAVSPANVSPAHITAASERFTT
jgi:hypothetical protein